MTGHLTSEICSSTWLSPNRVVAQARAKLVIARAKELGWETLKPRLPGGRLQHLDDFCELYRKWASTKEPPLRPLTVQKNVSTLKRIARDLGAPTVEGLIGKITDWRSRQTKAPHSISTDLRCGAAVFTPKAMRFYADSGMTVVNPFAGIHVHQSEIKPFEGYPMESVQELIAAAKDELKGKDDAAYAVFLLALCAGLRAQEAAWVQRSHIRANGIFVESNPEAHVTKNSKSRFVPLPVSVLAELQGTDQDNRLKASGTN